MQAGRGADWFQSYLTTLLQRDIQDIARIAGLMELPRLLELIAARAGNLINFADLSRVTGLNAVTLKRYYTLLACVFLIVEVPAWGNNHERRLVKSPKVFLNDTGLLCYVRGLGQAALQRERTLLGGVLENFVVMELTKQRGWAQTRCQLLHYRTQQGAEVDAVLEAADTRIVGLEVKSSMDVSPADFKGLRSLADDAGNRFHRGFVLYTGNDIIAYGPNLWAVPISVTPPAIKRRRWRRRPACSPARSGRHQTKPRPDLKGRRNAWPEATICAGVTRMPFSPRPRLPRAALKPVGIARNFRPPLARISAPRSKASITLGTLVKTNPAGRRDWPERGNTMDRQALAMPRALPAKAVVTCWRSSAFTSAVSVRIAAMAARSPARSSSANILRRSPTSCAPSLMLFAYR